MFGKEELVVKNSVEDICDLCDVYISQLACKDDLVNELISFMRNINFYFYEIFLCVINILTQMNALQPDMNWWQIILKLMKHQMNGKRKHPIGQLENDTWLTSHPLSGVPPPISKYRIPFLLSVDKKLDDIISNRTNH